MWANVQETWDELTARLFAREFVIDEPKELVFTPPASQGSAKEAGGAASPDQADMVTQMSRMLAEQDRLQELARLLERQGGGGGEDEFFRFVKQALPFLDNFERLLELARENPPSEETDSWLKSVETLYYRITRVFEQFGLRFVNSVGKEVDLNFQDVVEYRNTRDSKHNTVLKDVQKGVVFRGRLLRDARVVVACNE